MTATEDLLKVYEVMQRIRQTEVRLSALFADNQIPGFIHSSVGQEAIPAAALFGLLPQDTIASNHRGHGHAIARGVSLNGFFAEIMARKNGFCAGRGGSMHVADASVGMLGANGIVGAGLPIALGSALAHQVNSTNGVAIAFFGDGALAEGILHECLNLAQLWKLPLLFLCENNGWSEFTPTAKEFVTTLPRLADAFGIRSASVNGNDARAVLDAASDLIAFVRSGAPAILEAHTIRVRGHFEGDQQRYRDAEELKRVSESDPLALTETQLREAGVSDDTLAEIRRAIAAEIEDAVSFGRNSPLPTFEEALADVYSPMRRKASS